MAADLPEKTEIVEMIGLEEGQALLYKQVLAACKTKVFQVLEEKGLRGSQLTILSALMKLRQLCCHPDTLEIPLPDEQRGSGKFEHFKLLIDDIVSEGHRVLVFSQFTRMLKLMAEYLNKNSIRFSYLDGSTVDREAAVREFQQDENIPVFLLSLKAGGVGLNLTGADYVIHYDPWWNPAVENQATDRAHRIGQSKNVMVYKLITKDTVEEKIRELQVRKSELLKNMLDDEGRLVETFSIDDVRDLFG